MEEAPAKSAGLALWEHGAGVEAGSSGLESAHGLEPLLRCIGQQLGETAQLVRRNRALGQGALGYVATGRGNRAPGAVISEVHDYRDWCGIHGVFLDETATSEDKLPTYRRYTRYVHDHQGRGVLNPGAMPGRGYFDVGDAVVTFESTASDYRDRAPAPPWLDPVPAHKLWTLVTDAPSSAVPASSVAWARGAGSMSPTTLRRTAVTSLPSYWHHELESVRAGCRSG
jgi:hypothetical protein